MNRIGIIAAMKPELEILLNHLNLEEESKIGGICFYTGTLGNKPVVLCECGVGKVNAAMAATLMLTQFECDLLINTGIAGGIGLHKGDVVLADSLRYHDVDATAFGYSYGQIPGMPKEFVPNINTVLMVKQVLSRLGISYQSCPVYSGDCFVESLSVLKNILPVSKAACEMEGAAIAQCAVRFGVDFLVLRYISDCIGEDKQVEDYVSFEREMAERSAKICLQFMNNL